MKRPVIGVLPLVDDERESLWMLPGYMNGIEAAGGLPLMLPLSSDEDEIAQMAEICDGFLFTGGHDVSPEVYGMIDEVGNVVCCPARDDMESKLLCAAIDMDIPILGICRGIQIINAALGGTLYQDIPTERPTDINHHQTPPYDIPAHRVRLTPNGSLYALLGTDTLDVNSYHHQAVKALAPGLKVMAVSEDGFVEAVEMPEHRFVWALQWHPEFAYKSDENCFKIFKEFVGKCPVR